MKNVLEKYIKGGSEFVKTEFETPPCELFPTYAWIWNSKITKQGIKDRIDAMKMADIRSFYVLPLPKDFSPRNNATDMEPDYLTDGFFELIKYTVDYAKSQGLAMWMYDEGGWPSGMACGQVVKNNPEYAGKKIIKRVVKSTPDYKSGDDVILAVESGDDVIEYAYEIRKYPYCKDPSKPHYQDAADVRATDLFIKLTYDRYKAVLGDDFGGYIPLAFTDEPGIRYPAWTDGADKIYSERFGEDIRKLIPSLFDTTKDGENDRIKFNRFMTSLMRKNYFARIREWCNENGVYFSGHMNMDHILAGEHMNHYGSQVGTLREFDIPGIDVIWRQIRKGGMGDIDGGYAFFPRIAASAANQNGKNLAVSETFGIYGNGLNQDEMRYVANYQYVRGINIMNVMAMPYSVEKSYGHSYSPMIAECMPGYENLKHINGYFARMTYLTTLGKRAADTAVIVPVDDVLALGEREAIATKSFEECGIRLERLGIDFDIIDDEGIEKAIVEGDELVLGNARYKSVILPDSVSLDDGLIKKLGGILNKTPKSVFDGDFEKIRVMKRKTSGGELYFIFNEGDGDLTPDIRIDAKYLYRLDCESGRIYGFTGKEQVHSGDMLVIYASANKLDIDIVKEYKNRIELTDFESKIVTQFVLDCDGAHSIEIKDGFKKTQLGKWECPDTFSGVVCYKTEFLLEKAVASARLEFGAVLHSARVVINGKEAGSLALSPYTLELGGGVLKEGKNVIEIYVASTMANEFSHVDPSQWFEPRFLAPGYAKHSREFEKDSLINGLFGPATLLFS